MTLTLQHLSQQLDLVPPNDHLVVALSGGIDSVALLHGLFQLQESGQLNKRLSAIHVNHGLQQAASEWQAFCEAFCGTRSIPLVCRQVDVSSTGSLENAARESRYRVFTELLEPDDLLLLAHHLDDQLETFLLRLQRGAGVSGLASMSAVRPLGRSWLYRPLLTVSRQSIEAFAAAESLSWVEDTSNHETQFDRNFLRQDVLPAVASRWPQYRESWSKSIALLNEASFLLAELAEQDLKSIEAEQASLSCARLELLSTSRLRNVLRCWLKKYGKDEPGWNLLQPITQQAFQERHAGILLETQHYRLQIFADSLHILSRAWEQNLPDAMTLHLRANTKVPFGSNGVLSMQSGRGNGITKDVNALEVRLREGGEKIHLPGRPRKALKKLFQEKQVPPWLRERTPLLYADGTLICVPGIGIADGYQACSEEEGITISWEPPRF